MRKLFFANPHTTRISIETKPSNPWNVRAIKWQVASSVWPKAHIIVTADNPQQALIQPSYRRNCCHLHCCCCCSGSVGTVRQPFRDDVFENVRRLISMSRETQMPFSIGEVFFWGFFFWGGGGGIFFFWSSGPPVPWSPGPPVVRSSGPPVLWSPGPPVLLSSGPLVPWSSGPLVLWSSSSTSVLDNHNNNNNNNNTNSNSNNNNNNNKDNNQDNNQDNTNNNSNNHQPQPQQQQQQQQPSQHLQCIPCNECSASPQPPSSFF